MYDYVIVGAGSAGCVLAARLSEDPAVRVLLLEAGGPDDRMEIRIPAAFSKLFKSDVDWAYFTEEQPHLNQRRLYWPRGKVLGGSSSINAMIYMRGSRHDYDHWAGLGNPGWSFADVLPLFKKSEDQQHGASEYHGVGGPLRVEDPCYRNPLSHAFVEAGLQLGLSLNLDFNGQQQPGVGFYQVTQRNGRRWSAADAYLRPALGRSNLTVETRAHATRVLSEKTRATGIEYVRDAKKQEARAGREVILCGGTVNSPQLLMLSGIGPADHLRSLGIPVVADLPGVGQNLQDHMIVPVAYRCTRPVSLAAAETFFHKMEYLLFHRGPLASNVAEAGAFVGSRAGLPAPDLQFHFGPVYYLTHSLERPRGHGFTVGPTQLCPASRGYIRLRSADPLAPPAIQPGYFSDPVDVATFLDGIRLARELAQARAFDKFRGAEVCPGTQVRSGEEFIQYLRGGLETLYHPVGTCKMGGDPLAVVDARLRVRGIEGLRVADASVMPAITSGNTNAPTILIAEKAAEMIRNSA